MVKVKGNAQVAERRRKILRLHFVRSWTVVDIARALGVSTSTVDRDIKYLRDYGHAIGTEMLSKNIESSAFELQEKYEERQRLRWTEFSNARDAKQKAVILNDIAYDEERHLKMLQSLGVIKKAPDRVDLSVNSWLDIMQKAAAEEEADGSSV